MAIGLIMGSIRPHRENADVSNWVLDILQEAYPEMDFELVDLKAYDLPLFKEPKSPGLTKHLEAPEAEAWLKKVKALTGYIFITPEYNHSTSSALKNALDYLSGQLIDKPVGIVSYGANGGQLAASQLREMLTEFQVADVSENPTLDFDHDWQDEEFQPSADAKDSIKVLGYQLMHWHEAMAQVRQAKAQEDTKQKGYKLD